MNENKSQKTITVSAIWAEWKQKLEDASWSLIVKRKELLTEQRGSNQGNRILLSHSDNK